MAIPGIVYLGHRSDEEDTYLQFTADLDNPNNNPDQVVAQTSAALEEIAERDHRNRVIGRFVSGASMGLGALLVGEALGSPSTSAPAYSRETSAVLGGLVVLTGAYTLAYSFFSQTPSEQLVRLWRQDPDRIQLTGISVAPVAGGKGAALALGGRF